MQSWKKRVQHRGEKNREEFRRFDTLRDGKRTPGTRGLIASLGLDRWYKNEILTLDIRNRRFVRKYNPHPIIDTITKIHIKECLEKNNIPVPETHFVVRNKRDLEECRFFLETGSLDSFVVKPDNTYGGKGILLVKRRERDYFITEGGREMTLNEVMTHIRNVVNGHFSRTRHDIAILEHRVVSHRFLEEIVYKGLSDVRVIVLCGYPVMAMARLPTEKSNWTANLHAGAVGAGLNLRSGKIFHAIYSERPVKYHPDSNRHLIGFRFPFWREILDISSKAQLCSGLGYVGVDVVIDEECGPLVLEVNKRPGLDIQKANDDGLLKRLKWVERHLEPKRQVEACRYYNESPEQKVYRAQLWDQYGWKKDPSES